MKKNEKKWYESKTLMCNILAIAAGVALFIEGQIAIGAPIAVSGIVNTVLRIISDKKIRL